MICRIFVIATTTALLGLLPFTGSAEESYPDSNKKEGQEFRAQPYTGYLGAHPAWSSTSGGIGSSIGYGADVGVLQRYDWKDGSGHAGLGAFYQGANLSQGTINAFGAQLLMRYHVALLAILLGTAQTDVNDIDNTLHFAWGGRLSLDYPIIGQKVTIGPGGSVILFQPNEEIYVTYAAMLALKVWW